MPNSSARWRVRASKSIALGLCSLRRLVARCLACSRWNCRQRTPVRSRASEVHASHRVHDYKLHGACMRTMPLSSGLAGVSEWTFAVQ